jgi:MFS family permease
MTGSGAAVGGVMMARTLPAILAAPVAGVVLDRLDRKKIMIASDLLRAAVAILFILILTHDQQWLFYVLSGLLMFSSPFFTSGRSAILPRITSPEELHTANALTQTTAWLTLSFGTMLGGISTVQFGYEWAFVANALSFLFSAFAVMKVKSPDGHFRAERGEVAHHQADRRHFLADITDSIHYMRRTPLVFAIALSGVGWATGGGAAQILFTLFGELVYNRGPAGIGPIWGFAGIGLVLGGILGHSLGAKLTYRRYLHAIWIGFLIHGGAYVLFSLGDLMNAIFCIMISRIAMGANNVQNRTMLLRHVPDALRGRIYTTVEAMLNATMMVSLTVASIATTYYTPRQIAFVAGLLSTATALPWAWATFTNRLPEPLPRPVEEPPEPSPVTPA